MISIDFWYHWLSSIYCYQTLSIINFINQLPWAGCNMETMFSKLINILHTKPGFHFISSAEEFKESYYSQPRIYRHTTPFTHCRNLFCIKNSGRRSWRSLSVRLLKSWPPTLVSSNTEKYIYILNEFQWWQTAWI